MKKILEDLKLNRFMYLIILIINGVCIYETFDLIKKNFYWLILLEFILFIVFYLLIYILLRPRIRKISYKDFEQLYRDETFKIFGVFLCLMIIPLYIVFYVNNEVIQLISNYIFLYGLSGISLIAILTYYFIPIKDQSDLLSLLKKNEKEFVQFIMVENIAYEILSVKGSFVELKEVNNSEVKKFFKINKLLEKEIQLNFFPKIILS